MKSILWNLQKLSAQPFIQVLFTGRGIAQAAPLLNFLCSSLIFSVILSACGCSHALVAKSTYCPHDKGCNDAHTSRQASAAEVVCAYDSYWFSYSCKRYCTVNNNWITCEIIIKAVQKSHRTQKTCL